MGLESARLVIKMTVQEDGSERLDYEASDDLRLITALGMLRWAEHSILVSLDQEEEDRA